MRVRADEHVSPRIVRAVRESVLSPGWELSHVRDVHERRTADETWIAHFAAGGGNAILSGDRKMRARPSQIRAIRESGLVAVFMSSGWSQAAGPEQAAQVVFWWRQIETIIAGAEPGECWLVPDGYAGEIKAVPINYTKALGLGIGEG